MIKLLRYALYNLLNVDKLSGTDSWNEFFLYKRSLELIHLKIQGKQYERII